LVIIDFLLQNHRVFGLQNHFKDKKFMLNENRLIVT